MSKDIGRSLGEMVGTVVDVDPGSSGDCLGKFFRVKVRVDVEKPLKRLLRVMVGDPEELCVVLIKYERMPNFCHFCTVGTKGTTQPNFNQGSGATEAERVTESHKSESALNKREFAFSGNCVAVDGEEIVANREDVLSVVGSEEDVLSYIAAPSVVDENLVCDSAAISVTDSAGGFVEDGEISSPKVKRWKRLARGKMKGRCLEPMSQLLLQPGIWNAPLIRDSFMQEEAESILQLPLSYSSGDTVIWHHDKRGEFTVKSAYKIAFQLHFSDLPSCSIGPSFIWKYIWDLDLPAKIKIFAWRACKDILPTKVLIFRRKISASFCCDQCGALPETVDHAIWGCSKSSSDDNLWVRAGLFLKDLMQGSGLLPSSIISRSVPNSFCWKPPEGRNLKLNVDAAVNKAAGKIEIGAVVRDSAGALIMAAGLCVSNVVDVVIAEAKAILFGAHWQFCCS
ncbi:hypothetical protein ACOSP7_028123 [Xanthoceras sorbifolium]